MQRTFRAAYFPASAGSLPVLKNVGISCDEMEFLLGDRFPEPVGINIGTSKFVVLAPNHGDIGSRVVVFPGHTKINGPTLVFGRFEDERAPVVDNLTDEDVSVLEEYFGVSMEEAV